MTSAELIKYLQAEDPEGNTEVCVGNRPIHFVSREPAYYDGPLQELIEDPAKKPYYAVIGAKYVMIGDKVQIHTLDVEGVIENDPETPVDYSQAPRMADAVKRWREETRKIKAEVELWWQEEQKKKKENGPADGK
jgi:hypothetical protein